MEGAKISSKETYKGKKIVIKSEGPELKLILEDKEIQVDFDEDDKTYSLYTILPYATFTTLLDLAKAIIDKENGGN